MAPFCAQSARPDARSADPVQPPATGPTRPMQAAFLTGHGGNDVVQVGDRPRPERRPGEVLVRVQAASVNRVDLYMRDSGAGITHRLPQIMGVDGAGVVDEVDDDETLLQVGQPVVLYPGITCGRCEFCLRGDAVLCTRMRILGEHRDGTWAQWVSVPAANVLPKPEHLDFAEAAALGVNHLTAWRMLFTQARLQPWETVLIFGIGGGVSLAALQLAKMAGAKAVVTSRDEASCTARWRWAPTTPSTAPARTWPRPCWPTPAAAAWTW
jgi:NADPH:quinone reductase-like Zn-dependent oxidoreductase